MSNVYAILFKSFTSLTSKSNLSLSCSYSPVGAHGSSLRSTAAHFNARQFFSKATRTNRHVTSVPKERLISPPQIFFRSSNVRTLHAGLAHSKQNEKRASPSSPRRTSYAGKRVPIPFGNIGKKELDTIFGHDISYEEGNKMLQILHSRRVTGALVEQGIYIKGTHTVPVEALRKALEWLRAKYPVDERAAADMWAEHEAAKLEETYIARAERLGLYKKVENPNDISTKNVYGTDSVIDDFKRFHEERRAREAKERKLSGEEQKQQELQLAKRVEAEQAEELRIQAREDRQQQRALQGMVTHGQEKVPEMSSMHRLVPSTVFGLALMAAIAVLGYTYTPPPKSLRIWPETPTAVTTILGTLVPITIIFVLWRIPRLWRFLNTYFVQTPSSPRAFGVLGNIFSHMGFLHLMTNVACIWFYGLELHEDIGRGAWLAIYLVGGIFGSLCSLWSHVLRNSLTFYSFGASGSVWALIGAWSYLTLDKPSPSTENWDFAIRASQWTVVAFQILAHFTPGVMARIDVASHVGGVLVGVAGAVMIKRHAERRKAMESVQKQPVIDADLASP